MHKKLFIEYLKNGEKSREKFKIGLEWENFIVDSETLDLIPYHGTPGTEFILKELAKELDLEPQFDEGSIIKLQGKSYDITMEPAGQIEFSSGQFTKIKDCENECRLFIDSLKSICSHYNLSIMPASYHPLLTTQKTNFIPKTRYNYLSNHFTKFGQSLAHDMMKLTTSVQASIDYSSEQDFIKKIKTINQLTPILIALYSNSPIKQNKFSGFLSYRGHVWENTDRNRCGFIKGSFDDDFCYEKCVNTLLDLPLVIGFRHESSSELNGITFKEYMQKNKDLSIDNWIDHISFLFTVVRAKQFIETRFYDNQQSLEMVLTIPALIKGLLYSSDSILDKVYKLTYCSSMDEAEHLTQSAVKDGLAGKYREQTFLEAAQNIYKIAREGLQANFTDELDYIIPLEEFLFHKKCSPGKDFLSLWEKNDGNILNIKDRLFI